MDAKVLSLLHTVHYTASTCCAEAKRLLVPAAAFTSDGVCYVYDACTLIPDPGTQLFLQAFLLPSPDQPPPVPSPSPKEPTATPSPSPIKAAPTVSPSPTQSSPIPSLSPKAPPPKPAPSPADGNPYDYPVYEINMLNARLTITPVRRYTQQQMVRMLLQILNTN